ncbi:MAG TPA: ZIP family zinc transporter [Candidatus Thermoplasmatota archaeon]|nr:ZIP family zinc transporter [Candidatus Thermoplasmatota archaeon]
MGVPVWLAATGWGAAAGSTLLLGAAVGYLARVPQRLVAAIMAFGGGVLISALSFDLMEEAVGLGGFAATAGGFLGGAALYTAANLVVTRRGARHRKRSQRQPSEQEHAGSGLAIALGALIDGIPESLVIGVSLLAGQGVSLVAVAAVALSNVPEGLSSSAGMRSAGRSARYVFGVWGSIAAVSGIAAGLGALLFAHAGGGIVAATMAVAAGAILAMLADTMLPEAFEATHAFTGLITVAGFLTAFALSRAVA